jgi:hypothetical protein
MNIVIQGLDRYVVERLSQAITLPLSQLTSTAITDIYFLASETIVYHQGVDQTSWWSFITIHLTPELQRFQQGIIDLFKAALQGQTIHMQFTWVYQPSHHTTTILDHDYPTFVTNTNQVQVSSSNTTVEKDIYHGNVFSGYEDDLNKIVEPLEQPNKKVKIVKSSKKDRS